MRKSLNQPARPKEDDMVKSDYPIPQLAQSVEAPELTTESIEEPTAVLRNCARE